MSAGRRLTMRAMLDDYLKPSASTSVVLESPAGSKAFAIVRNIPSHFHSRHLRSYFADFVENARFDCFHFKHRPEIQAASADNTKKSTLCCVVRFERQAERATFIADFNRRNWIDVDSNMQLARRCFVAAIRVNVPTASSASSSLQTESASDSESLSADDLRSMIELRPPRAMPRGNVGTPTEFFISEITACRLPPSLIKSLGLKTMRHKRKFEAVPFSYDQHTNDLLGGLPMHALLFADFRKQPDDAIARQTALLTEAGLAQAAQLEPGPCDDPTDIAVAQTAPDNDDDHPDNERLDDDQCEEWERHEALYDDVTEQDRTKEKKYEQEMEVVWEKGGPGLVWHMDKEYWDEREKGTDCDWLWADDWDVDYSVYYEGKSAGDIDARAAVEMRDDDARRTGALRESVFRPKANASGRRKRRHSGSDIPDPLSDDTYAGNLMKKMGWQPGRGLGREGREGRVPPVALDMQESALTGRERTGFGYRGERFERNVTRPPVRHAIVSAFDAYTDKHEIRDNERRLDGDSSDISRELLWRRKDPSSMKHS